MKTNPPVMNCGFGYLLSNGMSVLAMIGLILFAFVAR